jgi:hypothetical protein
MSAGISEEWLGVSPLKMEFMPTFGGILYIFRTIYETSNWEKY